MMRMLNKTSLHLFGRRFMQWLSSLARIFCSIATKRYAPSDYTRYIRPSPVESSGEALRGDLQRVSDDMRKVIDRIK
jgi:hypothetical protein